MTYQKLTFSVYSLNNTAGTILDLSSLHIYIEQLVH